MSVVFYTPNGDSISALRSRIQAAGVALLFTYSVTPFLFRSTSSAKLSQPSYSKMKSAKTKHSPKFYKLHGYCICMQLQVKMS